MSILGDTAVQDGLFPSIASSATKSTQKTPKMKHYQYVCLQSVVRRARVYSAVAVDHTFNWEKVIVPITDSL